jgi:hypothetical protein
MIAFYTILREVRFAYGKRHLSFYSFFEQRRHFSFFRRDTGPDSLLVGAKIQ